MDGGKKHVVDAFVKAFLMIEERQSKDLSRLKFGDKVAYVYDPLNYAKETHENYIKRYCQGPKAVLFLGMNPGPFGMAQTGVPFGDVHFVKNWLKIEGNVSKPERQHPAKRVEGLNCKRSEVSGARLWSLFEEVSKTPEIFFKKCFVHNYCPISFMSKTGKNVTPPEMPVPTRKLLEEACDTALGEVIKLLEVKYIIGIGKFAELKAKNVIKDHGITDVEIYGIMHPSPINPAANKGWKELAYKQLDSFGLVKYLV